MNIYTIEQANEIGWWFYISSEHRQFDLCRYERKQQNKLWFFIAII